MHIYLIPNLCKSGIIAKTSISIQSRTHSVYGVLSYTTRCLMWGKWKYLLYSQNWSKLILMSTIDSNILQLWGLVGFVNLSEVWWSAYWDISQTRKSSADGIIVKIFVFDGSTVLLMHLWVIPTFSGHISQLRLFQDLSLLCALGGRNFTWFSPICTVVASGCRRLAGAMPLLPRSEQSHQPSSPTTSWWRMLRISPRRNASSSGVSATLSYNALARPICKG